MLDLETIQFVDEHGNLVEHSYMVFEREVYGPDGVEDVITDAHLVSCKYVGESLE